MRTARPFPGGGLCMVGGKGMPAPAGESAAATGEGQAVHHASTARPFSANRPRGRFWMKRMMKTSTRILPSTAPA